MRDHGTQARYVSGCRCEPCTKANSAACKAYRAANLEAQRAREKQSQAAYRAANPDLVRNAELQRKYGITLAQRDAILAAQGGACALCGCTDFGKRGPMVDHDHVTGKVRAILCVTCNVGLGAFADDPDLLRAAADYVERNRLE